MNGEAPDMDAIRACVPEIRNCFEILNKSVGDRFLVGDSPSYADFVLYATLYYLPAFPESAELLGEYPNIGAYLVTMGNRDSAKKTVPPKV